jgi:hypothetical protein
MRKTPSDKGFLNSNFLGSLWALACFTNFYLHRVCVPDFPDFYETKTQYNNKKTTGLGAATAAARNADRAITTNEWEREGKSCRPG